MWVMLITAAMITVSTCAHAATVMPQELTEYAEQNNCREITDFFNARPDGPVNPPFVYGYLPGDEESSAVFWCLNTEKSKKPYSLLFMYRETDDAVVGKCPQRIEWHNPPRGLSIYKNRQVTLEGFVYLQNPKKPVPKNERLNHNAVRSYRDGVEELFYCLNGAWLVRQRH
jgi:hypothetical protein